MRRKNSGFTLLEVLVALAVLILGLASILPLFAVGTASHKRGMDQTKVSLIAPHISARIQERLYEAAPKDLKNQEYVQFGTIFKYDASFTPFDKGDPNHSAFVVRVTVRWSERADAMTETFTTILLRRMPF